MKHKRRAAFLLSVLLILLTFCSCDLWQLFSPLPYTTEGFTPDLLVHYLDVGQGDSIFIELPNGKTMLIDSGENYHGEGIISYIRDCGYNKIDYLIGTHPHSDHIGSMGYIVRNFDIGVVYMPNVTANTQMYENLLKSIKQKNRTVRTGKAGIHFINDSEHDVTATIVAPVTIDNENLNNSSIVLRLDYKDATFLFTGDAEKEELATITDDIIADVLKVGHHGSSNATTKDFLEKVDPQIAVISCGADNDYGHPHASTLRMLEERDCDVYRTDLDQTVTVYTDGERLSVSTGNRSIERAVER